MKVLFEHIRDEVLAEFNSSNTDFHLENFKLDNGQLLRPEQMNKFRYPAIFFSYDPIEWDHLGNNVRRAIVDFDLNLVIESYYEMEDSFIIDEYMKLLKNKVESLGYYDDDYFINQPYLLREERGFNESNLISYSATFRSTIRDFTNDSRRYGTFGDLNLTPEYIEAGLELQWILETGFWNDSAPWNDQAVWID